LQVTISPQEAIDAGAQWRVDGGFWHDSNDIETDRSVGFHMVEYKSAGAAWFVPAKQCVQIFYGQTTTITKNYIKRTPSGAPPIQWQTNIGISDWEEGESVRQTSDGGYITVGHTYSHTADDYDIYLIKTDPNGDIQWENTYPGSDDFCSGDDIGRFAQQTADGGYIIAGETQSYGTGYGDVYLVKTDPNGKKQWQKAFGHDVYEYAWAVQQTTDDGFIIAGTSYSESSMGFDIYTAKICSDGTSSADFNCDGIVYFDDMELMAEQWLQSPTFPSADIAPELGDGWVDLYDFGILAYDWLLETIAP
jgi:hypothetical protein